MIKRDEVPFEIAMAVTEALRKVDPDKEIVFAGDLPEDHESSPEMLEFIEQFKSICENSMQNGTCWGCGETMPGWPYIMQEAKAGEELPDGWGVIMLQGEVGGKGRAIPSAFECGTCTGPAIDNGNFGIIQVSGDGEATQLREFKD